MRLNLQHPAPEAGTSPRKPGGAPPAAPISITVVVCTRDRPALLDECLAALAAQTYPRFDVLVVDNAPSRPVKDICARWSAGWVPAPDPGLTIARNVGARAARGEVVAYLDDDAIPEAGWLEALAEDFRDPLVGAVSGRIRYMESEGPSCSESVRECPGVARSRGRFDAQTPGWFALACFGGMGDGGNMAFRREALAHPAAFDERIGRGRRLDCGDEHVAFASLVSRGYAITHCPAAVVRHPCPAKPERQREKRYAERRASIAYLAFVWHAFPGHRLEVLRFLGRAVAKRIRPAASSRASSPQESRVRTIGAIFGGLLIYARARGEWSAARTGAGVHAVATPSGQVAQSAGSR